MACSGTVVIKHKFTVVRYFKALSHTKVLKMTVANSLFLFWCMLTSSIFIIAIKYGIQLVEMSRVTFLFTYSLKKLLLFYHDD